MISVVLLTKNEEKNIIDCLETVLWADEIIVVDDNSVDRTIEVIKSLSNKKIKIYKRALNGNFSDQRNFGLSKTTKKWVLFIDADERVTKELQNEINFRIINPVNEKVMGYFVRRVDFLWGKELKHGEVGNISFLRLAKRDGGIWMGTVHEKWVVLGETDSLDLPLLHYPHQTINEFLKEINYYSSLRASELAENGKKTSVWEIIFYPKAKFLYNFFIKLGFLDGLEGLIFAIIMSFHSFLVRAKLWTYLDKKQQKS